MNATLEDAEQRLWADIETARIYHEGSLYLLGELFSQLRALYSERGNSGGSRRSSGHGTFVVEIKKRGFSPRRVREWIHDFEALQTGAPTTAGKQRARRTASKAPVQEVMFASPLAHFASLLPFEAAQAAYRKAELILHPDHGGDQRKMQLLNEAWTQVKTYYEQH